MEFVQLNREQIKTSLQEVYGFQRVSDLQLDIIEYLIANPSTQTKALLAILNNRTTRQNFYYTLNVLREKGIINELNKVAIRYHKRDGTEWNYPAQIREKKIPSVEYCEKMNYYYLNAVREIVALPEEEREKAIERFIKKESQLMQDDPDWYNDFIYRVYNGLAFFSLMSRDIRNFTQ